jgi:hypothetical protein
MSGRSTQSKVAVVLDEDTFSSEGEDQALEVVG